MHNKLARESNRLEIQTAVREAIDQEHLRLLAIVHYVAGGLTAMTSSFFLIHLVMGIMMLITGSTMGESGAMAGGAVFTAICAALVGSGWLLGGLTIYTGRCLQTRRHRTFAIVMSVINCILNLPWGLLMGIFTIRVLMREEVKTKFLASSRTELPQIDTAKRIPATALLVDTAYDVEEEIWRQMELKSKGSEQAKPNQGSEERVETSSTTSHESGAGDSTESSTAKKSRADVSTEASTAQESLADDSSTEPSTARQSRADDTGTIE